MIVKCKRHLCTAVKVSNEIALFSDGEIILEVPITPERDTVWLTQAQMSELFGTARSSIAYHINIIFKKEDCHDLIGNINRIPKSEDTKIF